MLLLSEPTSRPEIVNTVPSPSTVPVGYQRPPDIDALFVNVSVEGLNDEVFFSPIQGSGGAYLSVPATLSLRMVWAELAARLVSTVCRCSF